MNGNEEEHALRKMFAQYLEDLQRPPIKVATRVKLEVVITSVEWFSQLEPGRPPTYLGRQEVPRRVEPPSAPSTRGGES